MIFNNKGEIGYTYTPASVGSKDEVICSPAPKGTITVAKIHTHSSSRKNVDGKIYDNEHFSGENYYSNETDKISNTWLANRNHVGRDDIGIANAERVIYSYLVTPGGILRRYNPRTGKIAILSEDLPSDPTSAYRANLISAFDTPPKQESNLSTYFYKSKRKEASPYNIKEILEVNKKYRELLNKVLYE